MSKRCHMSKNQTPGLWRRFTIKINWHNEVCTYWCQFWHHIWRSSKLVKIFPIDILKVLLTIICDVKTELKEIFMDLWINGDINGAHHWIIPEFSNFDIYSKHTPLVHCTPQKLSHDVAYIFANLRLDPSIAVSAHCFQDIFDFLKVPLFGIILKLTWSCQKLTCFKIDQKGPKGILKVFWAQTG